MLFNHLDWKMILLGIGLGLIAKLVVNKIELANLFLKLGLSNPCIFCAENMGCKKKKNKKFKNKILRILTKKFLFILNTLH
jgi:asparagine synthetase B (glutamine-hydrolysing)